jgi:hypothetical protein
MQHGQPSCPLAFTAAPVTHVWALIPLIDHLSCAPMYNVRFWNHGQQLSRTFANVEGVGRLIHEQRSTGGSASVRGTRTEFEKMYGILRFFGCF